MKKSVILLMLTSIWFAVNAQLNITIQITKEKKAEIFVRNNKDFPIPPDAPAVLADSGNTFKIINESHGRNFRIIIQNVSGNQPPFALMLEENVIPDFGTSVTSFNKGATPKWEKPVTLFLPCQILVQKKDSGKYNLIASRTIITGELGVVSDNNEPGENAFMGIPVYDALSLSGCNQITDDDLLEILNYYNGKSKFTSLDSLKKAFADNKFLSNFLVSELDPECFNPSVKTMAFDFQKIVSSVGGLDVTSIADGFAKFIVKRTKQELSIAFFDKFNQEINKYPDLKTVFPQTCRTLSIIGDEIYNYEAYIQTLRESFENDLSTLPANLPGIVENHPEFFSEFPELAATLKSGCYIAGKLKDKIHPGDILADYPVEYLDAFDKNLPYLKGALQTLQLISASFRDGSDADAKYWVTGKEIKELLKNEKAFKIYLGLLYQEAKFKYDGIRFNDTSLLQVLNKASEQWITEYPLYKNFFTRFSEKTNKISLMIEGYTKSVNDSLAIEQFANYFNASIDFLEICMETGQLVPGNWLVKSSDSIFRNLKTSFRDYFDVARTSGQLVLDINRRNYAAAVTNAVYIYDLIYFKYKAGEKEAMHKFFKYGTFMASIVQAKTSDDVEKVIESFALPTGSARIKRETPFNVSLNAYCGLFAGYEKIKGIDPPWTWTYQKFNTFGVTAPVGIALSRGHSVFFIGTGKKRSENNSGGAGWSSTIFLSLIDIGAVTAFRFTDDSTEHAPTIQLEDIISPGIFFSLGFPKTPLSVNIGWQIGPLLREITATTATYKNNYTRISLSLCVDIPILNFYTKPKKQ